MTESKLLVIDACVARSAGGEGAVDPVAKRSRDCLKQVLEVCHRLVVGEDLNREWMSNSSNFAKRWLVEMKSRKKLEFRDQSEVPDFEHEINCVCGQNERMVAFRDLHLIQTAIIADKVIISKDSAARRVFCGLAKSIDWVAQIHWLDLNDASIDCLDWLSNGAPLQERLRLGADS